MRARFSINRLPRLMIAVTNALLILAFIALICLPAAKWLSQDDQYKSFKENRALAQMPDIPQTLTSLEQYPDRFENYFNDQFGFRTDLVRIHSLLYYHLGISPSDEVIIGKNGWLYYRNDDLIRHFGGTGITDDLRVFCINLDARYQWLKGRGIKYVYVIAPTKYSIYPEYLPNRVKIPDETKLDKLIEYLKKEYPHIPVIDLRGTLIEAKNQCILYYKIDTHWNDVGANIAQYEIADYFKHIYPEITPTLLPNEQIKWDEHAKDGNLAQMIGLRDYLEDIRPAIDLRHLYEVDQSGTGTLYVSKNPKTIDQRLLVFHDSFGKYLLPYLSGYYFTDVCSVNCEPTCASLEKCVDAFSPDIVIEQRFERPLLRGNTHIDLTCAN